MMKIGIDVDGVLTDVIRYACDYGSKYFFWNLVDANRNDKLSDEGISIISSLNKS